MKFRDKNRLITGHIIGKCYYGAGTYSKFVWKVLGTMNTNRKTNPVLMLKHIFPKEHSWAKMEYITAHKRDISLKIAPEES